MRVILPRPPPPKTFPASLRPKAKQSPLSQRKVLNGRSGSPDQNNLARFLLTAKYTARLPDLAFHEGGIWFWELQMGKSQLDSSRGKITEWNASLPRGKVLVSLLRQ